MSVLVIADHLRGEVRDVTRELVTAGTELGPVTVAVIARDPSEHVLEGSVRMAGRRVRVTAQLVTTADGSHVWSERYDRELTDVFSIQDEIARAIADRLRVGLVEATRPLVKAATANPEAYNRYLLGRHQFHKGTPEGFTGVVGGG